MKTATLSKPRAAKTSPRIQRKGKLVKRLKIRNILVPVDFSPASLEAIESAKPWVKQFGASLHLVHVFEHDFPISSTAAMPLVLPELEVGKRVRRRLKDLAKMYSVEIRPENIHALKGLPFEEICRLAREQTIDLIVIATRGNTGLKHVVLGSTAERVVRYSPCRVLVTRPNLPGRIASRNGKPHSPLSVRKILAPIDFSDWAMKGVGEAKRLAKEFRATLVLFNSVHPQYYVTSDEYARYDFPKLMEQAEKASEEQLHELVQRVDWEGVKVETLRGVGHPGQQICDRAKDCGADLIVTSTHGRTGLKHILIGSTAEFVVRHAHCAVLVVPGHERITS